MIREIGLAPPAENVCPGLHLLSIARGICRKAAHLATMKQLAILLLFLLWAICNPYFEIDRSNLIYAGRALADIDPNGVGRDLMFAYDGQSGFTIFTPVYSAIAAYEGVFRASMTLAAAAVVLSFTGAVVLAGAVCRGRSQLLAITFAATLPACYGGYKLFSYAETAATPRPFAEALVLFGLAALVSRRFGLAGLVLSAAGLMHPIMAMPGFMIAACWCAFSSRRHFALFAVIAGAILLLAIAHPPPFDRLVAKVDPEWKSVLVNRSPQVFPSLWPEGWIGRFFARASTLLIAASLTSGAIRKLFLLVLLVSLVNFASSYFLTHQYPVVLIVQAQIWRSMWLVFSLATVAAAICVIELWSDAETGRIVLALLGLGWIFADHDRAMLLDASALAFHFCLRGTQNVLPKWSVKAVVVATAILAGIGLASNEYAIASSISSEEARRSMAIDWDYTPIAVLAAILIVGCNIPPRRSLLLVFSCLGTILLGATWDRRSLENRYLDAGNGVPDLLALIDTKPGEVFWIDGNRETWTWLGRPQWISSIQGAGLVFSRPLSIIYRDRSNLAIKAGLADDSILAPFSEKPKEALPPLDPVKIAMFCADALAPAWLIVPVTAASHPDPKLDAVRWSAPIPKLTATSNANGMRTWKNGRTYDIVSCAH